MQKRSLRFTLLASILLHSCLVLFAFFAPRLIPPTPQVVDISFVDAEELRRAQQLQEKEMRQIVEQSEAAVNNEAPEDAKFLSRNNQTVKKQTQAAQKGEFRNTPAKTPGHGTGGKPKLSLNDLKPTFDPQKAVERKVTQEKMIEETLDKEALKMAKQAAQEKQQAAAQTPGNGGAQASQTQDYLKDVETSMETMLSTKEFVYYSFYARIRKQLNQHWSGKVREKLTKMFNEGRSIASEQDKVTKLMITLNQNGQLVKVQVLNDSGIRDLDDAAIEAFRAAAPFPNPPKGILESDGTIKIRWDFILEA